MGWSAVTQTPDVEIYAAIGFTHVMEVGEHWAFRARLTDPLTEVRVEAIGLKRPSRTKVTFLSDAYEGRSAWVVSCQLKVRWTERDAYESAGRAWQELRKPSSAMGQMDEDLIGQVFRSFMPRSILDSTRKQSDVGIILVKDWTAFSRITGLTRSDVQQGLEIEAEEGTYLPWPSALVIAKVLARRNAQQLLVNVDEEEGELLQVMAHGKSTKYGHTSAASASEEYDSFYKAFFATLREWSGEYSAEKTDEIQFLRQRVALATDLLNRAIDELRELGQTEKAWSLHVEIFGGRKKPDWQAIDDSRAAEKLRRGGSTRFS